MALTDDLISFWELEESSGTRVDSHGSNDLIDNDTVGSATGKVGNAVSFVGVVSEYLSLAGNTSVNVNTGPITIALWAQLTTKSANRHLFNKGDEYFFYYDFTSDRFKFEVYGTAGFFDDEVVTASALGSPSTGAWYFLVVDHNPVTDLISIQGNNGTINTASHALGIHNGGGNIQLGRLNGFSGAHDGLLDQIGFWKRVLTSDERTFLYNGGAGRSYAQVASQIARPIADIALGNWTSI